MSRHDIPSMYFDTPFAAAKHARDTPRHPDSKTTSESELPKRDWCMNTPLAENLDNILTGYVWDEGLDMLNKSMAITDELTAKSMRPQLKRVQAGGIPCVPAAIVGHPKAMYTRAKQPQPDMPVLSIGISMGLVWATQSHHRLNLAAAMLSAVDELERQGYRCELTAVWRASNRNTEAYNTWCNIEIRLKAAGERWNPASIAYIMGHPASTRRLFWRLLECEYPRLTRAFYCSNTNTPEFHRTMSEDFDIYFNNMSSAMLDDCDTPERAFEYVSELVNARIVQNKDAAQ